MANNTLIQGAGMVSGNKTGGFTDIGGAFTAGSVAMSPQMQLAIRQNLYKKRQDAIELQNFVNNMGDINVNKVEESMRPEVNNFLITKRNEYAEAAKQASRLDADDPGYAAAVSKMNEINSAFKSLSSNLDKFKENREKFYEDTRNNSISDANGENIDNLNSLYKNNDYDIIIGPGGSFQIAHEDKYIPFEDFDRDSDYNYHLKNNEGFNTIMTLTDNAHSNAKKIEGGLETNYRHKLNSTFNNMGREDLLSMVYDNNLDAANPIIDRDDFDEDLLLPENDQALRDYLSETHLNALKDVAEKSHKQKEINDRPKPTRTEILNNRKKSEVKKNYQANKGIPGRRIQGRLSGRSIVVKDDGQGGVILVPVENGSPRTDFYITDDASALDWLNG